MKDYVFTAMWGILVWLFATLFFRIFGEYVLFDPGTHEFVVSILLLLIGTSVLLYGITFVYLLIDKTNNAALRFGIMGTIIGLVLDTFSLSNHHFVFPALDPSQVIAFSTWMSFAYALYLFIPFMFNLKISQRR